MRNCTQMNSFKQIIKKGAIAWLLLAGGTLVTSCSDQSEDNTNPKMSDGVKFTIEMSDWDSTIVVDGSSTRAANSSINNGVSKEIELNDNVSATVSIANNNKTKNFTRAVRRRAIEAGEYTIAAYQGTANNPIKKAEIKVHWDGNKFTNQGQTAKMSIDPGTYTFICYNEKLIEKNGHLVMSKYDRTSNLTTDADYINYQNSLANDYDQALAGKVTATVRDGFNHIPFVLSHPWARVKFEIAGVGLKTGLTDTFYSSTGSPRTESYNADINKVTIMQPSDDSFTSGIAQTLSSYELNPISLSPINYTQSAVNVQTGVEKINNKRVFHFGELKDTPGQNRVTSWLAIREVLYQNSTTPVLYFPAGANLKAYQWNNASIYLYRKTSSYEKLYEGIKSILPTSLAANGSYTVRIFISYNFKYLFNDGTIGTLAENNNWKTKSPIALVTSMKDKTAMAISTHGGRVKFVENWTLPHVNTTFYQGDASILPTLKNGYRTTYDPTYSYDGNAHANNQNLPAFYNATHYKPGATVTAEWLKNPSTDVNDPVGKWYLPSYGEMVTMYKTVGHGTNYNINSKKKEEIKLNTWYEWQSALLNIACMQGGGSFPPTWHHYWTSTEIKKSTPNKDFAGYMGWLTNSKFILDVDNYNQGVVIPFIHFK